MVGEFPKRLQSLHFHNLTLSPVRLMKLKGGQITTHYYKMCPSSLWVSLDFE